jgi:hypothetical protein
MPPLVKLPSLLVQPQLGNMDESPRPDKRQTTLRSMPASTAGSSSRYSNAVSVEDRWRNFESSTKDKLNQWRLNPSSLPGSQATFRTKFEELCRAQKIPNVQTLLCKVDASFYRLDSLIEAINRATFRVNFVGFGGLIWGMCFAIFQVSCGSQSIR